MRAEIIIGRTHKLGIAVHWTFVLLLLWIIFINTVNLFRVSGIIWSLALFISLLASLTAHELAHFGMARFFRVRISGMLLLPVGAVNKYEESPKSRRQELLILLAGPLMSLLLAALLSFFNIPFQAYWNLPESIGDVSQSSFLFQLELLNFSLFFFNLIPVFPMDGGNVLRVLLSYGTSRGKATDIVQAISLIIGGLLVIAGIFWINLLSMLLGFFILLTHGVIDKTGVGPVKKGFSLQH